MTPFLLVNGPARHKLEINFGTGCLGPGWRANATIGRAIRLIMNNAGGALPGVYSKVSFGSPLRYSYICGENEEENPWTPFHVDRGFKRDIQQRLWELARLPISHFAESFASTECAAGRGDENTVWRARSPDEIYIAVAGGPGPQDVYIGAGMPQTRVIQPSKSC